MATLILLRHGRTSANADGILAGRMPGVELDDTGTAQVKRAGERVSGLRFAAIASSPMERCQQTAEAIRSSVEGAPDLETAPELNECDYGEWQGKSLKELTQEPLWKTIQDEPSTVVFPGGEAMEAMQSRAVEFVRRRDADITRKHGNGALWLAVSHGDVIKSILADALGMSLDLFQRLHADPASMSMIRYTERQPFVLASNTHAGDLAWLAGDNTGGTNGEAAVGGGRGPSH